MAGMADDVIQRLSKLASSRIHREKAWQQAADVAAPDAGDFSTSHFGLNGFDTQYQTSQSAKKSKNIYDSTAVWSVDRLASGLEALIVPQSDYWHGYDVLDLTRESLSDEEKLWLERLRNLTFRMRYDTDSGWVNAMQTCLRRMIVFGNAFMFIEDGIHGRSILRYRYLPLRECFIAEDHYGNVDTFYRLYQLTARQALQKFGERVSQDIKSAAESNTDKDKMFTFVHCISPRADFGAPTGGVLNSKYASLHIEHNNRRVVGESGYYDFPVVPFRWMPEPGRIYGEGPVERVLADIQSLQVLSENELMASHQSVKPPLLVAHAGVMNRPNTNPDAINMGGLSTAGEALVKPMFTGQRLDFATQVLEARRNQVKESMYINLFALLVQNPEMSATEAMIRANEKGELLGPAGSRIQHSLSHANERELGIMERAGVFNQGSAFEPPESLQGTELGPEFTSPLDRLRKGREVEGMVQWTNTMAPISNVKEDIFDWLDEDKAAKGTAERLGMPVEFIRSSDDVAAIRAQRAEQQQAAADAQNVQNLAAAGKDSASALSTAKEAGLI